MNTNLIETYLNEIGRRLPRKNRADIEAEIHSILQDMLEERSRSEKRPVDDAMLLEVLREYGDPGKVAASYLGERYLIGPQLFPIFLLVLRIALLVLVVLAALGLGIGLMHSLAGPQETIRMILKSLVDTGTSAITVLGNIVLVFAISEWALNRGAGKSSLRNSIQGKAWDPSSLAGISKPNQLSQGEIIAEIVGSFAAIVIFNFYPQIIGYTPSLNSLVESGTMAGITFIPLLSSAFFSYVPYLTAIWGLSIVLDIYLLRLGHWNVLTRIGSITLKLANVAIAAIMLAGPSLVAINQAALGASLGDAEAGGILAMLLTQMAKVVLVLVIILESVDIAKFIYRLFFRPQPPVKAI